MGSGFVHFVNLLLICFHDEKSYDTIEQHVHQDAG